MRVEARAPTRIDLAGGTLDIWPLYLFQYLNGAGTINCAISLYASCTVKVLRGKEIVLESRDTRRAERFASLKHLYRAKRYRLPLLAHMVRFFNPPQGFRLITDSQAPAGAGIGGSSAMAVAMCAALDRFTGWGHGRVDWIHISRDIEAIVLRAPTGTQDHYPAAFGGVNAILYGPGDEIRSPVPRLDPAELERRLLLCYTGKPRRSAINNWRVFRACIERNREVCRNLQRIGFVSAEMMARLSSGEWTEVGRLMREEWGLRRRNLPTISTPTIDRIIGQARRAGALGGKVCGAGGGGCVALVIEPEARTRVEAAVQNAGGQLLPIRVDRRGVRVRALKPSFAQSRN